MLNPAYKLIIGDKIVDTTDEPQASTVVNLTVTLDMATPADNFNLVLGQVGSFRPEGDDETTIELGYADNGGLTQVISGKICKVEPGLTTAQIMGFSSVSALLQTFVDETFESKTAGQIVGDLADRASVDVANAEDGITFPAYVIDGRRSIYDHMRNLADLCGFDLHSNSDGELVFEQFTSGNTVHVLEYKKHLIEIEGLQTPSRAESVEVWGESPAGSQGDESWAWLTKDFSSSKGTAGSGSSKLLIERPVLRTADAAGIAADAALTAIQRQSLRGRVLLVGRPEIKLGDAVRFRDVPEASLNAMFQVRSVTHRLTKVSGFTSTVEFRSLT